MLKAGVGSDNRKFEKDVLTYFCTHSLEPLYVDEILEALVQRRPDLLNGFNRSLCLSSARQGDSSGLVFALSKHGANIGAGTSSFKPIFENEDYRMADNIPKTTNMIKALIAAGANVNDRVDAFKEWHVIVRGRVREPVYRKDVPVLCLIAEDIPKAMKDALEAGGDPNVVCHEDGSTPLMLAKDLYSVKALIEAGADINARRQDRKTVLEIHAESGTSDTVKALLDAGAQIDKSLAKANLRWDIKPIIKNYLNGKRYSATNLAYLQDYTEDMVKDVVDHGGDINQCTDDKQGETLLYKAVLKHDERKVKLLLRYGADPNIGPKDSIGGTLSPLRYVCLDDPRIYGVSGVRIAKLLIDAGADVNVTESNNTTPLMNAANKLNLPMIKLLLERGADVQKIDYFGRNVLFYLKCYSEEDDEPVCSEIVDLLLKHGADVRHIDNDGNTTLMGDSFMGYCTESSIKKLIDAGVDVNARNKKGKSTLMRIKDRCRSENNVPYQTLIKAGANVKE